jgi:hypothetical protein
MKLKGGNRFEIDVDQGEQITLRITQSTGIVDLVNYSLDGGTNPGPLPLKTPCNIDPDRTCDLAVTCTFTDPGNGNFTVQVTGSKGGDVSTFGYDQAPGEAFKTLVYTFFI